MKFEVYDNISKIYKLQKFGIPDHKKANEYKIVA